MQEWKLTRDRCCNVNSNRSVYLWSHSQSYYSAVHTRFAARSAHNNANMQLPINNNNNICQYEDYEENATLTTQLSKLVSISMRAANQDLTGVSLEMMLSIIDLHPDLAIRRYAIHCLANIWFSIVDSKLKAKVFKCLCEVSIQNARSKVFTCILACLLHMIMVIV